MTLAEFFQWLPKAAHFLLVLGIWWAVTCRARHMSGQTLALVRWQHGLLNACSLLSLIVSPAWAPVMLAAGPLAFLALGSIRWRDQAPAGTKAPRPAPQIIRAPWLPVKE